jgi:Tfp pilus assembly protein PilX
VIDGFAGRRSAIPFALLVLAVLGVGLVVLLMLNTAMDENSIKIQQAQQKQAGLTDREQQLSQQLAGLSAPANLASEAAALGLVPNPQPAFINPTTDAVLGSPSPAATPTPSPAPTQAVAATASSSVSPTSSATPTAGSSSPSSSGSPR